MDRRRRGEAVSTRPRSGAASRWRGITLLLGVLGLASLSGCRDRKEEARQKAELTNALERYKAQVAELQKQTSALRVRFDKLPEDLPETGRARDDLHALEEVVGVEDGRTKWLSMQLDKAFASGDQAAIDALKKAIPSGTAGTGQVGVKVMHEILALERVADQRHFFEEVDAANAKRRQNAP